MTYLIVVLATWRTASLLVREDGPFDILARFRYFIGVRYDDYSRTYGKNVVAKAFTCVWCISLWISLATTFFINPANVAQYFITWLAVSAGVIIVDEVIERLGR